jgi:hypothetical protein
VPFTPPVNNLQQESLPRFEPEPFNHLTTPAFLNQPTPASSHTAPSYLRPFNHTSDQLPPSFPPLYGGQEAWIEAGFNAPQPNGILPNAFDGFSQDFPQGYFEGEGDEEEEEEEEEDGAQEGDGYEEYPDPNSTIRGPINLGPGSASSHYSQNPSQQGSYSDRQQPPPHNLNTVPHSQSLSRNTDPTFPNSRSSGMPPPSSHVSTQSSSTIPAQRISQFTLAATAAMQRTSSAEISAEELNRRLNAPTCVVSI